MSKLLKPKEIRQRKQSLRKDSEAKKTETKEFMSHLVSSRGYAYMKQIAAGIAAGYRTAPGGTREEQDAYLTHCTILWAYNMMWKMVEDLARSQPKRIEEDRNDDW